MATKAIGGLPNSAGSYGVLSSGDASIIDEPNTSDSSGLDLDGGNLRGDTDFDVTVLRIDLNVPSGTNCMIGLDFRFYSEEFQEFVGSEFNDAFIAELDQSTWTTSGSEISAPGNFAFDPTGNPITINAAGVTSMTADNAAGTTFDGATPLLRAATPISPGAHSLYLSIFDQGDGIYDSAVIIDNLRFGLVQDLATQCKPGAVPIDTGGFKYVALGDSFSAGEGIEPFFEDRSYKCHRSKLAYSTLVERPGLTGTSVYALAKAGLPGTEWGFQACSGAVTDDVTTNYRYGEPAQLELNRSLDTINTNDLPVDAATDLVTLTIGGNNVHFSDILSFCYISNDCTTERYKNAAKLSDYIAGQLSALGNALPAVYSKIHAQAPAARILVLGYPQLFPASHDEQTCFKLGQKTYQDSKTLGFTEKEQNFLRAGTTQLNQVIKSEVEGTGFAEFIRVDSLFAGHEVCGNAGEWINGPSLALYNSWSAKKFTANDQTFHPNNCGQAGMAVLINLRVNGHLDEVVC